MEAIDLIRKAIKAREDMVGLLEGEPLLSDEEERVLKRCHQELDTLGRMLSKRTVKLN